MSGFKDNESKIPAAPQTRRNSTVITSQQMPRSGSIVGGEPMGQRKASLASSETFYLPSSASLVGLNSQTISALLQQAMKKPNSDAKTMKAQIKTIIDQLRLLDKTNAVLYKKYLAGPIHLYDNVIRGGGLNDSVSMLETDESIEFPQGAHVHSLDSCRAFVVKISRQILANAQVKTSSWIGQENVTVDVQSVLFSSAVSKVLEDELTLSAKLTMKNATETVVTQSQEKSSASDEPSEQDFGPSQGLPRTTSTLMDSKDKERKVSQDVQADAIMQAAPHPQVSFHPLPTLKTEIKSRDPVQDFNNLRVDLSNRRILLMATFSDFLRYSSGKSLPAIATQLAKDDALVSGFQTYFYYDKARPSLEAGQDAELRKICGPTLIKLFTGAANPAEAIDELRSVAGKYQSSNKVLSDEIIAFTQCMGKIFDTLADEPDTTPVIAFDAFQKTRPTPRQNLRYYDMMGAFSNMIIEGGSFIAAVNRKEAAQSKTLEPAKKELLQAAKSQIRDWAIRTLPSLEANKSSGQVQVSRSTIGVPVTR